MEWYDGKLIGRWMSVIDEIYSTLIVDETTLEFTEEGLLFYTTSEDGLAVIFNYHVNVRVINIASPGQKRTLQIPFELTSDGKLLLTFKPGCYVYARKISPVSQLRGEKLNETRL